MYLSQSKRATELLPLSIVTMATVQKLIGSDINEPLDFKVDTTQPIDWWALKFYNTQTSILPESSTSKIHLSPWGERVSLIGYPGHKVLIEMCNAASNWSHLRSDGSRSIAQCWGLTEHLIIIVSFSLYMCIHMSVTVWEWGGRSVWAQWSTPISAFP